MGKVRRTEIREGKAQQRGRDKTEETQTNQSNQNQSINQCFIVHR